MNKTHHHKENPFPCYLCGSTAHLVLSVVEEKPSGETDYAIPADKYYREICRCNTCEVYFNKHNLIPEDFYQGQYNQAITLGSLRQRYDKIMSLPGGQSDNKLRVSRILSLLQQQGMQKERLHVLDVGSGTCVFLGEMKKHGINTTCVDPDPQAVQHALTYVAVDQAYQGSLQDIPRGTKFDLITFNKVLEHVKDPISLLREAVPYLSDGGIVYVELPDGDPPVKAGIEKQRQEFFIEHYTIFNPSSFQYLAAKAGFELLTMESIHEPSGKYSIYGLMKK